ncbi:MAG: helix-turn-helix transcriptional regulator [Armatimonadetes bacterium]|jgi:MerR family transcriptional regulator/heat shock protein HspR|nr:helix-turn-helix transcriptional regulator [Armatimonadota bacterium]
MRDTIIITDVEVDDQPVYVISVAARLCEMHPQTLRTYERLGLVCPHRSDSRNRLYSPRDIERLRRIQRLTRELGVNLAGVEVILELLDRIDQYQKEIEELRARIPG